MDDVILKVGGSIGFVVLLVGVAALIVGCSTVGKSKSTLIRAISEDEKLIRWFPQYVTKDAAKQIIPLDSGAQKKQVDFDQFMEGRYGALSLEAAALSVTVRDRTKLPPFLPVDVKVPARLFDLYSNDGELSLDQRIELEQLIAARLYNVPDLVPRTTLHHYETSQGAAQKVFYTYPRLHVDFSASLNTQKVTDRFSYLGIAIVLGKEEASDEAKTNAKGDHVRFVDFSPKDADLVEYTRGQLTQAASLNAKGSVGSTTGTNISSTRTVGPEDARDVGGSDATSSGTIGAELSYMMSDTYVNELRDAFERRMTGLFDHGQVFLAEFRATSDKRIGGTYNFDLMLEIPADVTKPDKSGNYESMPIQQEARASIYLVGVVRHVYKRGMTGLRTRVPEPRNDKVYEQVVTRSLGDYVLWRHGALPWSEAVLSEAEDFIVTVYTNRPDARFVVRDVKSREILGAGHGEHARIALSTDLRQDIQARVEFLDVAIIDAKAKPVLLEASEGAVFTVRKDTAGSYVEAGEYNP